MTRRRVSLTLPCALAFVLASSGALPAVAWAEGEPKSPKVDEGRTHFVRGVDLYREGDFRAALIEFQRAYELAPSFRILYNIGQANLELLDYPAALRAFERYLADGGAEVPQDKRAEVEGQVAKLQNRVARVRVESNVDGAEVTVDDLVVGTTPLAQEVLVGIGRHRIAVVHPKHGSAQRVVDVGGGDRPTVSIPLDVTPLAPPPPPRTTSTTSSRSGVVWGGVVVTSSLAVATGIFGYLAYDARHRYENDAAAGPLASSDLDGYERRIRRYSITTDVLAGVTLVAGGATLYLALTRPKTGADVGVSIGPGSIQVGGRF
jgi:hypothetical protein